MTTCEGGHVLSQEILLKGWVHGKNCPSKVFRKIRFTLPISIGTKGSLIFLDFPLYGRGQKLRKIFWNLKLCPHIILYIGLNTHFVHSAYL